MREKIYGYIRVSTKDQNEDRQRIALLDFGVQQRISIWTNKVARILSVHNIRIC